MNDMNSSNISDSPPILIKGRFLMLLLVLLMI